MDIPSSLLRFLLVTVLLTAAFSWPAAAQKYRTAAGLRIGDGSYGLTVQQVFLPKATLEGIGMAAPREISATILAERHFGILGPSLNYYVGAGGHFGNNKDSGQFYGADVIVGAEYKVAFLPFVVAVDVKPSLEFNSDDWARFPTAFSVRYVILKKRKTGLFNWKKDD